LIDDKIGSKVNNLLSLPEPNCTDFHAILRTTNSPNDVKQNNRYKTDQTRDRRDFSRRANHDKLQLKIVLKSYVKEPEREEVPKISMSVKGLTFISLARFTCRNHSLLTMAFPNPLQHYQSNLDPSTIEIEDILRFQSLDYLKQLNTTTSKPHSPSCQDGGLGIRVFQSDNELDTVEEISSEAGNITNDPDFTLWYPKNKAATVSKLNDGLFHQLLEKFQAKKWKHGIIYLAALSM